MRSLIMKRIKQGQFAIIAECGVNFFDIAKNMNISPMDAAKLMVKEAAQSGAHGVKFQSYKAEALSVKDAPAYWDTNEEPECTQYDLFKKLDRFNKRDYIEIAAYCIEHGIEFVCTAFDQVSADYLDEVLNVYKISSSDITNIPFIRYQARKRKPVILSTGASNLDEIETAVKAIRETNDCPIVLLHCVLEYPTPYEHANLNKIVSLRKHFPDLYIGYSDHTKPDECLDVVKTAYNIGALVIEKHFTLNKNLKGNDHYHAMDSNDLKKIVWSLKFIDSIRGSDRIEALPTEFSARKNARRSIVAARKIRKGDMFTEEMFSFKRPGHGISPAKLENVLGKNAETDIEEDTVLLPSMIRP